MKKSLALSSVLFVACSGGNTSNDKTLSASPPAAAPAPPEGEAVEPAGTAANVAGAFLAGCSYDTRSTFVSGEDSIDVTACIVLDQDGKRAPVEGARIRVRLDGAWIEPPVLAPTVFSAPWHVGVELKVTDASRVELFEVTFQTPDRTQAVAATDNGLFSYISRADYLEVLDGIIKPLTVLLAPTSLDKIGYIKTRLDEGVPLHITMLTNRWVKGNVGVEAADAICEAEGEAAKIPRAPASVWRALLSTSTTPAKEHLRISANEVVNFEGVYISDGGFYDLPRHFGSIRFDSLGYSTKNVLDVGDGLKDWVYFAWTGTKLGGTLDEVSGNCKDWTSDSPTDFARVAKPTLFELWDKALVWPCSRPARLICMLSHEP